MGSQGRPLNRPVFLLVVLLAVVCWPACGNGASGQPVATPTRSSIAAGGRSPHPSLPGSTSTEAETLLATLSGTLDRVAHEDVLALVAATVVTPRTCNPASGPCPPGVEAGTEFSAFPYVACDAHYASAAELPGIFEQVFRGRAPQLYSVLRTEMSQEAAFPLGPFAAVFETAPPFGVEAPTGAIVILNEAGGMPSLRTGCRATAIQLHESLPVSEVLIEPQR